MKINLEDSIQEAFNGTYGGVLDFSSSSTGNQVAQVFESSKDVLVSSVSVVKIIAIVAVVILVGFFVWLFIKTGRESKEKIITLAKSISPPTVNYGPIKARWEEIERHLNSYRDAEWKFAIIEADKLVDDVLEKAGFKGETMADKLKMITKSQLNSLSDLWDAHKLRNLLVHNTEFEIKHNEVRYAIDRYKKVLQELNVIE